MSTSFCLAKNLRNLLTFGIVAGLLGPFAIGMSQLLDDPPPPSLSKGDLVDVALMPLVTVVSILLLIIYYRRSSIKLLNGEVLLIDVPFLKRLVKLPEIESANWDAKARAIYLMVSGHKTKILFDYIDPPARLELVRSMHALIPKGKQEGWPTFCQKFALPLRQRYRLDEPLNPDEWRPNYRRSDVIFSLSTIIGFAIAGTLALAWSLPALLVYPLLLLPVWAITRTLEVPGRVVLRKSETRANVLRGVLACVVAMTLTSIAVVERLSIAGGNWWLLGILSLYFVGMFTFARLARSRQAESHGDDSAKSAQRWDDLERGVKV